VSPRRNRPRSGAAKSSAAGGSEEGPGTRYGIERTEEWRGDEWAVRQIGGTTGKRYRCPGCDQEIPPGVPHVVAWPRLGGVDDMRHWHKSCWNARDRRGARVQRSRNAPRY
jgi:hypothetical protein